MSQREIVILLTGAWIGCILTHTWQFLRWVHLETRKELERRQNIADYRAARLSPLPPIPVDVSRLERRGDVARVVRLSSWRRA